MRKIREIIHCILWAIWVDTGQPKFLLPLVKWINNQRVKRYEL